MPAPVVALVVAAGRGSRFGGSVPKPLADLAGRPVVAVTIDALVAGGCTAIVAVVPQGSGQQFLPAFVDAQVPVALVEGGETRQASVLRGLEAVDSNPDLAGVEVVLVHDAVRPLVPAEVVTRVVDAVRDGAVAVTPTIPVVDSLRLVDATGSSRQVERTDLHQVQTPQGFDFATLLGSHRRAAGLGIAATDDVGVCEAAGHPVTVVAGAASAFKITHAADLELARALVAMSGGGVR